MYIELLKDIKDPYYNVDYSKGDLVRVLLKYNCEGSKDMVIGMHGHGVYTYANEEEYRVSHGEMLLDID